MPPRQFRLDFRALLLAGAALAALSSSARATDLPATPEGAAKIAAFFATYAGKAAATAPALVVTLDGSDYLVAADVGALTAPLESAGVHYDSAVFKFKVFQQDDAAWRVEIDSFPLYHVRVKQKDVTTDVTASVSGLKSTTLLDTTLNWIRSGQTTADKLNLHEVLPGIDLTAEGGPLQAAIAGKAAPDGSVSTTAQESFGPLSMTIAVDPKAVNPSADSAGKPFNVASQFATASLDFKLDGAKPGPLLDLWAFLVAHPSRPELAADEPALKTLLSAVLASQMALAENVGVQKLSVQTPQGTFTFDGGKFGVSATAAGPSSRFEQHFAASGIALPPGLVPAPYQVFVPTSFDLDVKVSGFDLTAAGTEAIADLHLAGDAPPISAEDGAKVSAKMRGPGPLVIDIPSSQIHAAQLDVSFEGQVRYAGASPRGAITLHMRNFDKTVAALKAFGPDAERKMVPLVAMAKGLAKTDPDGVMTWVGEVGDDGIMKVNGLPLGKAPF